jgi:hypothetical protein
MFKRRSLRYYYPFRVVKMKPEIKLLIITGIILAICLTSFGCITIETEEPFDVSKTKVEAQYMGKNSVNDSIVKIILVENSPRAEDVFALIEDPNGEPLPWHAFGENPGEKHPISAISHIDISGVRGNEDISWNDIYEDHKLRPDEEFFISKEIVPPNASGYKFVLEHKKGKRILEVEIEPLETTKKEPKPMEGTMKDIKFHIEIEDNSIIDGEFKVSCSLKNMGEESVTLFGPGLGFPTLDFFIYTPEDTIIHYLGPWVRCRCLPDSIELTSGEYHKWISTIGGKNQIWGEDNNDDYIESYKFKPGNYIMYGNYTSDLESSGNSTTVSGWTQSNIIYFTLKDTSTSSGQLKCEPEVWVTGINYTSSPFSVPYKNVHTNFSENYTGTNLSVELRNLTMKSMLGQAEELGENTTILYESIKVTYYDWGARPNRIPTYAEKAIYNDEWVWAIAFNRANGHEGGIEHIDIFFVSISTIQTQYSSGCNSTAIVFQIGCD